MKVVLINGSPRKRGCTYTGLKIIQERLSENQVDSEIIHVGNKPIIGCTACQKCQKLGKCFYSDDLVNEAADKIREADGVILGSAVHYASVTGAASSFFDRLFYSMPGEDLRLKFGASVVSCRRAGASTAFDQLNKYFTIRQMPVVSSNYWNQIHGNSPTEVYQDEEGVQTLQVLADNMAYLIKCCHASNVPVPQNQTKAFTNFIR
ncbi:flavodoxin family protein [Enterococcus sp. AZ109]|uniref:flavodoxin family protein n=1 Tax=Enterococcus sp. AZ109 TaxID=2774634 RepID=UPI003F2692FA